MSLAFLCFHIPIFSELVCNGNLNFNLTSIKKYADCLFFKNKNFKQ